MDNTMLMNAGLGALVTAGLGFVLAIAISIVTQYFHVEADPKIEQIHDILPHFNCGACGYPGCMPYAEALVNDSVDRKLCRPGGAKVAEQILALLEEN